MSDALDDNTQRRKDLEHHNATSVLTQSNQPRCRNLSDAQLKNREHVDLTRSQLSGDLIRKIFLPERTDWGQFFRLEDYILPYTSVIFIVVYVQ